MRQSRIAIIVVLLTAGLLGVYWVALGQEGRVPWPPPPVKLDEPAAPAAIPPPVPPVPSAGTMPPAGEKKPSAIRKWISGNASAPSAPDAHKGRVCGVGGNEATAIRLAGFQEVTPEPPPPTPPKITVPPPMPPMSASAPKSPPVAPPIAPPIAPPVAPPVASPFGPPMMPDLPMGAGTPLPVGPGARSSEPASALPMPAADPPRVDPLKSVITDPVQQAPQPGKPAGKPPSFVLFNGGKPESPTPTVSIPDATPVTRPPENAMPQPVQHTIAKSVSPGEAGAPLLGVQTPPVTVEKRGSVALRAGEVQVYQFIVRNLGTVVAPQVRVEDDFAGDARLIKAEPMPQLHGGRASWLLTDLAPGAVRVLNLMLQGGAASESAHSTRVHVTGAGSIGTITAPLALPASVAVQITAPPSAVVGKQAVFEVRYANTGKQRLTGLVLHAILTNGLLHPAGQDIEANPGDLEPGVSKTIPFTVGAAQPGRQSIQVHLKGAGGAEASAQASVEVAPAPAAPAAPAPPTPPQAASTAPQGLVVQVAPAVRLFAGRFADLRIEITNNSAMPMRHVAIASYLPEGLEFVEASDYGNHQPNARTVNWLLDPLPPGNTQALLVRVKPAAPGTLTHQVGARANGVPEARASGSLTIESIADLVVALNGNNSVELGKETVYEVRVGNPGSGANTNVRVELAFGPGLVPRNARGPVPFRIEGQSVVFEGLSTLVPQGQTTYHVLAVGQAPGDARVRASVISDQVRAPTAREMGTRVYRD